MIAPGNQTIDATPAREERDESPTPAISPSHPKALGSESQGSPTAPPLTDLVNLNYNLRALAQRHSRSPLDLLDWLNSQPIRQRLSELEDALALVLDLRTLEARRTAVDALEQIAADHAADPTQRRLAATALLCPPPPQTPKARGSESPGSPPPPIAHSPPPIPHSPSPTAHSPPPPTSPDALITTTLESIAQGNPPAQALAELHAHFAPNATLNDHPVPDSPEDFDDDARRNLLGCVQYLGQSKTIEETRAEHTILFVHRGGRCVRVTIASAKSQDDTWRISALTAEPIDSS